MKKKSGKPGRATAVRVAKPAGKPIRAAAAPIRFSVQPVEFASGAGLCKGDLYVPARRLGPVPLIIMAHGLGAERGFRLPAFADRFASAGAAVLLFDYRNFGSSPGEPRNLIAPSRHVADWQAAIRYAGQIPGIDQSKVILWGTSLGAGHVITVASGNPKLAALCLLVPFSDGFASLLSVRPVFAIRAVWRGIMDVFSTLFGRGPHNVKVYGSPSEFALLNTEECEKGYGSLVDLGRGWTNQAPARIALTLPFYRPIARAAKITAPTLIICGEQDSLIPLKTVEKLARRIQGSMTLFLPTGHFEPYTGAWFERTVDQQLQFLRGARGLLD